MQRGEAGEELAGPASGNARPEYRANGTRILPMVCPDQQTRPDKRQLLR